MLKNIIILENRSFKSLENTKKDSCNYFRKLLRKKQQVKN